MPEIMRATNNHVRFGASANNAKLMHWPVADPRMTVRLPKRSDNEPRIGEKMNCARANTVAKSPT